MFKDSSDVVNRSEQSEFVALRLTVAFGVSECVGHYLYELISKYGLGHLSKTSISVFIL